MLEVHKKYFDEYRRYLDERVNKGELKKSTARYLRSLIRKWLKELGKENISDLEEGFKKVKLPYHNDKVERFIEFVASIKKPEPNEPKCIQKKEKRKEKDEHIQEPSVTQKETSKDDIQEQPTSETIILPDEIIKGIKFIAKEYKKELEQTILGKKVYTGSGNYNYLVGKVARIKFLDGDEIIAEIKEINTENRIVYVLKIRDKEEKQFPQKRKQYPHPPKEEKNNRLLIPLDSIKYFAFDETLFD